MYKDYNINQVVLPLDLEIKLKQNDIAFVVNGLIESIPEEAFEQFYRGIGCPLRSLCTKAATGKNRKLFYNEKWESQKEYIKEKLSNEETGEIYGKRKIDVEPFFGFLKANLGFTRMSVRGKSQVHNEIGFALMAVNIRKYTAINNENGSFSPKSRKSACIYLFYKKIQAVFYLEASFVPAS